MKVVIALLVIVSLTEANVYNSEQLQQGPRPIPIKEHLRYGQGGPLIDPYPVPPPTYSKQKTIIHDTPLIQKEPYIGNKPFPVHDPIFPVIPSKRTYGQDKSVLVKDPNYDLPQIPKKPYVSDIPGPIHDLPLPLVKDPNYDLPPIHGLPLPDIPSKRTYGPDKSVLVKDPNYDLPPIHDLPLPIIPSKRTYGPDKSVLVKDPNYDLPPIHGLPLPDIPSKRSYGPDKSVLVKDPNYDLPLIPKKPYVSDIPGPIHDLPLPLIKDPNYDLPPIHDLPLPLIKDPNYDLPPIHDLPLPVIPSKRSYGPDKSVLVKDPNYDLSPIHDLPLPAIPSKRTYGPDKSVLVKDPNYDLPPIHDLPLSSIPSKRSYGPDKSVLVKDPNYDLPLIPKKPYVSDIPGPILDLRLPLVKDPNYDLPPIHDLPLSPIPSKRTYGPDKSVLVKDSNYDIPPLSKKPYIADISDPIEKPIYTEPSAKRSYGPNEPVMVEDPLTIVEEPVYGQRPRPISFSTQDIGSIFPVNRPPGLSDLLQMTDQLRINRGTSDFFPPQQFDPRQNIDAWGMSMPDPWRRQQNGGFLNPLSSQGINRGIPSWP